MRHPTCPRIHIVSTCRCTCTCMHRWSTCSIYSLIFLDLLICDYDSYRATSLDCVHMTSCVHYTMQKFFDGRLAGALTSPSPSHSLPVVVFLPAFLVYFFAHLPLLCTAGVLLVFVGLFPLSLTVAFRFTNKSA